jgi:two-component system, NtrC family, nitrogen regulation response regulator GlnG
MAEETRDLTAQHVWGAHSVPRPGGARSRIPVLTILYHPDLSRIGERAFLPDLAAGRSVPLSRSGPEFLGSGSGSGSDTAAGRPLSDLHVSRSPLHLVPGNAAGAVRLLVGESRTRVAAEGEPVQDARDFSAGEVQRGVVLELAERIVLLLHEAAEAQVHAGSPALPGLIGENEGIQRLRNEIWRVADLDLPVLIRGETGTGKELVARAIHETSRRRAAVCISVNMGAVPPTLASSELFGVVRGAYTGAVRDQPGYFQRAHGGTLFLDEVGETPLDVQVMLLRVLETGEVQRVGSPAAQKVDVRLITATDADLEAAIAEGRFRAPLLHRLTGYEMWLPPLRERRDDFGRLLLHFLRQELAAVGEEHRLATPATPGNTAAPWLPASLVARLARHDWPGNVRQLRNAVRQIVIDSRSFDSVQIGPQIERLLRDPGRPSRPAAPASSHAGFPAGFPTSGEPPVRRKAPAGSYRPPADVPVEEILAALKANHWEVKSAASDLGISRPSLYVLMDKLPGIRKAVDLEQAEIQEAAGACRGDLDAMAERLEVSKRGLVQRMRQLGMD